jgi:hypothetical protein
LLGKSPIFRTGRRSSYPLLASMRYCRLIVLLVVLVSGCATCRPERILQLTPQGKSTFTSSSHDGNGEDLFLFDERTSVWLKPCVSDTKLNRGSICATIMVPPGHIVSLESPEIRLVLEGEPSRIIHIPNVTFLVSCSSSGHDPAFCTPDDRGVKGPVTRKMLHHYDYQGRWVTLYEMSVDPLTRLPGGQHSDFSLGQLLAYKPYRLNAWRYTFPVVGNGLTGPRTLFLPSLVIDGIVVELPPVNVTPTVANVCTRPPV